MSDANNKVAFYTQRLVEGRAMTDEELLKQIFKIVSSRFSGPKFKSEMFGKGGDYLKIQITATVGTGLDAGQTGFFISGGKLFLDGSNGLFSTSTGMKVLTDIKETVSRMAGRDK